MNESATLQLPSEPKQYLAALGLGRGENDVHLSSHYQPFVVQVLVLGQGSHLLDCGEQIP